MANYRLCSQLLGNGEFIDHDPRAAGNSYCDKAARYTFTLQCYIKVFVCGLPDAYWLLPHTWATDPELCRWLLQSHELETNNHRGQQAASQYNQRRNCERQTDIPEVTWTPLALKRHNVPAATLLPDTVYRKSVFRHAQCAYSCVQLPIP